MDVTVASAVLLVTSPLIAAVALLVRLDSPGPVFFRHQRIGMNRRRCSGGAEQATERRSGQGFGKPFTLYKFRTMYADARTRFPELYAYKYTEEELYTLPIKILVGTVRDPARIDGPMELKPNLDFDPRVTRVGRWLRGTSLDELPNFWNVLKGDMLLVGPRPDIEENMRYYKPHQFRKLEVKPGITGLAQINGRGALSFHETNDYDYEYVQRRSLSLDLRILLKTVFVILGGKGAC